MQKLFSYRKLFIALTIPLFILGCRSSDNSKAETLYTSDKRVNFTAETNLSKTVKIKADEDWKASINNNPKWCTVEKKDNNTLEVIAEKNEGAQKRTAEIKLSSKHLINNILVEQLGTDAGVLINKSSVEAKTIGDLIELSIISNTDIELILPNWIKEEKITHGAKTKSKDLRFFAIEENNEADNRLGSIEIRDKNDKTIEKVIVKQKGLREYNHNNTEGLVEDIKIKPIKAISSSEHPKSPICLSIDGNLNTYYHSAWKNNSESYFPIEIVYSFENDDNIDYIIYYPRADQNPNGSFKNVEIQAISKNQPDFEKILDVDFEGATTPTKINLPQSLTNPKAIKFIVKSGTGDNKGYAACAEMEFFKQNPEVFDYSTLFTDQSCSTLKPGITKSDIDNCQYPFYQNIAYRMLSGDYDQEFRIETFKAYPHPNIQSEINKSGTYSLLDNPTGIYVKENEDVVIFAKETNGAKISVLVQNLDLPEGDGFGGPSFPISTGLNKFKAPQKGLLYVMYHNKPTDQLNTYLDYSPIKLHFATGSVNGYFNSQKHTEADWSRLLDNSTSEYFDVLGKYAHLTYPVNIFRKHTSSGLELINLYDQIVHDQMDLMGLFKYDSPTTPRVFRNRMYFNVMYHSYMYSTSYRTGYHEGTLSDLANVEILPTEGIWGPAHEVGHSNQTKPGFQWVGMTEVTNNVHSQYVQTNFGNISRLQGEDLGEGRNRFEHAMTNMFPTTTFSYSKEPDVFCKLIPLWQLQLYFSWVLGNDDIYKDIHEDVRLDPDKGGPGMNQMWFAYRASKASGYDLTDFFEKWGFFVPIDEDIEDYWVERMTITPARVNEVKAAIKDLNLPKPKQAIEYVTDRTTDFYKNNLKVSSGAYSIDKKKVSTTGCENAVAIEVFEKDRLVFVGTVTEFNLFNEPNAPDQIRVEAISADGSRVILNKN